MKRPVFLLADERPAAGWGHVSRCLALAEMLRERFEPVLLSLSSDRGANGVFRESAFERRRIQGTAMLCTAIPAGSILVIDRYDFPKFLLPRLAEGGVRIVMINDVPQSGIQADLLINHTPGIEEGAYVPGGVRRFALGLDYAVLQAVFLEAARKEARRRNRLERSVFVCFGGTDPLRLGPRIAWILAQRMPDSCVHLVSGHVREDNGHPANLKMHGILTRRDLLAVMRSCKTAVLPASTVSLEAVALRIPLVTGYYAENQKFLSMRMEEREIAFGLGDLRQFNEHLLLEKIRILLGNHAEWSRMGRKQRNALDGDSDTRLRQLFGEL